MGGCQRATRGRHCHLTPGGKEVGAIWDARWDKSIVAGGPRSRDPGGFQQGHCAWAAQASEQGLEMGGTSFSLHLATHQRGVEAGRSLVVLGRRQEQHLMATQSASTCAAPGTQAEAAAGHQEASRSLWWRQRDCPATAPCPRPWVSSPSSHPGRPHKPVIQAPPDLTPCPSGPSWTSSTTRPPMPTPRPLQACPPPPTSVSRAPRSHFLLAGLASLPVRPPPGATQPLA